MGKPQPSGSRTKLQTEKHEHRTKMNKIQKRIQVSEETSTALAEASTRAATAFSAAQGGDNITTALAVAAGIKDLRTLFDDPGIMESIMELQDTAIGFRTDRDPKITNRKTSQPNIPYGYPVVKDCAIEAGLRGLQMVGNQWNIIGGRQYTTKEGFEFLIAKRLKDVADFKPICGVPKNAQGGTLVEFAATWKQAGVARDLTVTIPIKTDDYSGADQILGKAMRKGLARCYSIMTGQVTPDGDADDAPMQIAEAPQAKTEFVAAKKVKAPETAKVTAPTPLDTPRSHPGDATHTGPTIGELQTRFSEFCTDSKISFDDASDWLKTTGKFNPQNPSEGFFDIPDSVIAALLQAPKDVAKLVQLHGKVGA